MTAITVTSCDVPNPPPSLEGQKIYTSVEECDKGGVKNCLLHHQKASQNHLLRSPKYTSEKDCKAQGHEMCVDITLEGGSVWLPKMVGFMENDRPIYLKKLDSTTTTVEVEGDDGSVWEEERELTAAELKEREVVAGPVVGVQDNHYNYNSPIIIGGWYPTPVYYSRGFSPSYTALLHDGMAGSSSMRTSGSVSSMRSTPSSVRVGRVGSTVRGGFGSAGRGFGGGS